MKHRDAFLYLIKYLEKPHSKIPSANVFRQVQADLSQRPCNSGALYAQGNTDNISNSTKMVMESDLSKDETKVLPVKQREQFENQAKAWINEIEQFESRGETDKASDVDAELQRLVKLLKKEYSATMDESTGKITEFNRIAKGKNRSSELARTNLKNAVEYIIRAEGNCALALGRHLRECLLKHKDIYQPPTDFPKWGT